LVPLVAKLLAFDFTNYDQTVKTWNLYDELIDNQVTAVLLDEHFVKNLPQITKTNRVALPEAFRFLLLPTKPVFPEYVGTIGDLIVPCYGMSETGGLVCAGAKGSLVSSPFKSISGSSIVAAGMPLGGISVRIDDQGNRTIRGEPIGQIVVQSEQVMTRYSVPVQGRAQRGAEGSLLTGDYGSWHFDEGSRSHLVVVGAGNVLFERRGQSVSLFDLELTLFKVPGVKDVVLVEFPHTLHGQELAAFVVVLAQYKGRISREDLWRALLRFFPWEVVPKIFMIADERQITSLPVRSILVDKLEAFSAVDFSKRPPV
jgi:acyl-CoA synthetase (AMP-forming)/AMP-acid ligase II